MKNRNSRVYETCKIPRNEDIDLWFQRPTHNGHWSVTASQKNKAVILLSTMHHKISIDEEDHKKRPENIKFFNKMKIGVDLVDQMVGTKTCRRQTRRWPLKLFFNLLDAAALNAYTVYRQVHPEQQSTGGSRRRFLTYLADSLILPHVKARQKISQLQKSTKEAVMRCGLSFSNTSPPENILLKRKRCCVCYIHTQRMGRWQNVAHDVPDLFAQSTASPPSNAMNAMNERRI